MDICHNIVDAIKKELKMPDLKTKLVSVTSSTRIPLVANGTIDLSCGSATNNAQRQVQVSFAPTTFVTAPRFTALKKSDLNDLADFKRLEEHTAELQSLMRIPYAVFCLKKK